MNSKNLITAVVVSLVSLGAADLMGVPVSGKVFAQGAGQNQAIAQMQEIIRSNQNNPAALESALASYLTNNPGSVSLLSEAVGQATPGYGTLLAIGNAAATAYRNLARAGNTAAAASLKAEAATLPGAAQAAFNAGTNQNLQATSTQTPGQPTCGASCN